MLLHTAGWRGCGEFVGIAKTLDIDGVRTQVCAFDRQLDQNGIRRSRTYWEIRTPHSTIQCPKTVRSMKAAIAFARAQGELKCC